jgi:hypothetical protein
LVVLPVIFAASVFAATVFAGPVGSVMFVFEENQAHEANRDYKAIRLPPVVYNMSNRDLSDIRILDEAGNYVPYFINSYETVAVDEMNASYTLVPASPHITRYDDTSEDFRVEEIVPGIDVVATAITVRTDSGMFAKNVQLWGGYDGRTWDFITEADLYRVDGSERLTVEFYEPLKYTYYRFTTLDNTKWELDISEVVLEYSSNTFSQMFFTEPYIPQFEIEEHDGFTVISLSGLKNVRINELTIVPGSNMFKRPFYFANGRSKELYYLWFADNNNQHDATKYQDLTLDFEGYAERSDTLEIRIANGDDAPIEIEHMSITYFTDEIVFRGGQQGDTYTLTFGDPTATRPVYDIANYTDLILSEGYNLISLPDQIIIEPDTTQDEPADYSLLFNAVVVIVSVMLGVIILFRLRRSR